MKFTGKQAGALALTMTACTVAHAGFDCSGSHGGWRIQTSDNWTGTDKLEHFAVSATFGALGAYLARDTEHPVIYGTLIGSTPGLVDCVIDLAPGGSEAKDRHTAPLDRLRIFVVLADVVHELAIEVFY